MADWQELLTYPFDSDKWVLKIIIGTLLSLVPVINLVLFGYAIACMEMGVKGRRQLPGWEDWREHVSGALSAVVIVLAFMLIPFILIAFLSHIPLIGSLLGSITVLLAGALVPMALAAFSLRRDISDAFRLGDILRQISSHLDIYLSAYIFFILACCVGLAIIVALPYLAFIGSFLIFYSAIVFSFLIGCTAR